MELRRLGVVATFIIQQCCSIVSMIAYRFREKLTKTIYTEEETMTGKVVIIAGATNTVGVRIATELARRGARLILPCHDFQKGLEIRKQLLLQFKEAAIDVFYVDLASLKSVRTFAAYIKANEVRLDVFINNVKCRKVINKYTHNQLPRLLQVNYYGPTLLMVLLLPLLKLSAPSRILSITSDSHNLGRIIFREFDRLPTNRQEKKQMFCNINLANILIVKRLARKLIGTGVTINNYKAEDFKPLNIEANLIYRMILKLTARSVLENVQTAVMLASSKSVKTVSGLYFKDCRPAPVAKFAHSVPLGNRIWKFTHQLLFFRMYYNGDFCHGIPTYERALLTRYRSFYVE